MLSLAPVLSLDQSVENSSKYYVNKRERAPKQEIKAASKKAKKAKLDPEQVGKPAAVKMEENEDSEDEKENVVMQEPDETLDLLPNTLAGASIQEMRAKIHERIMYLQQKRMATNANKQAKRLQLKEAKEKAKKEKKKATKTAKKTATAAATPIPKSIKPDSNEKNSTESVIYSKFDLGETKKQSNTKNLGQILKKLEKKKENLEAVKAKDINKAKEIISNEAWDKALKKSEGEKIRDDPKLIKKSLKAEKKKKMKSAEEWKKRHEDVKERIEARQMKRSENIQKRKEDKQSKKKGKGAPKKQRPGFEGSFKKSKSKK